MKISGSSPWLLAFASAVVTAFGWIILYGQVGPVKVPQPSSWGRVTSLCPDDDVDAETFAEVMVLLEDHHLDVRAEDGPCDQRSAIHIRVSPADVERVWPSSEALGEYGQLIGTEAQGAFERRVVGSVITDCDVWLRRPDDTAAMVHEVLHGLGYEHPRNAPSGHVMSRDYLRMGIRDWRGI